MTDLEGLDRRRGTPSPPRLPRSPSGLSCKSFSFSATVGDYIFVHAGVRPGVPIEHQDAHDLLWIRKDFMEAPRAFERTVVVHGHTPAAEPAEGPGRIGVDTGAYATGVLTAVRLEDDRRSFIRTGV